MNSNNNKVDFLKSRNDQIEKQNQQKKKLRDQLIKLEQLNAK